MRWQDPVYLEGDAVKVPTNWLFIHYYEVLSILFRIENSLRMFVYVVLKDKKKSGWYDLTIKTEDGSQTTVVAMAKRRLAQDKTFGYLGYSVSNPLMHLTSGELIRIILDDAYWSMFSEYFPASKEIVRTKLEEIGNVRNALAHFRPVKPDDVQVVKQNANQVLSGIEKVLSSVVECPDTVPTNTQEAWYSDLKVLSGPYVQMEYSQSVDERWVRLGIQYSCPLASPPYRTSTYCGYRILSLNTPRILRASSRILENVIFAYESIPYLPMPPEGDPQYSKIVRFLFSRETMREAYAEFKPDLEEALRKITTETDLIKEDNLARGEFVHTVSVSSRRSAEDKPWYIDTSGLHSGIREDDPPEYWVGVPFFGNHFVSDTESFPWTPVTIARFTMPF
jgi:hypothetical protein